MLIVTFQYVILDWQEDMTLMTLSLLMSLLDGNIMMVCLRLLSLIYVIFRYRAPELLCNSPNYGKGLDIWSVGCIFAELLTHKPFFCGMNPQHQLEEIIKKVCKLSYI